MGDEIISKPNLSMDMFTFFNTKYFLWTISQHLKGKMSISGMVNKCKPNYVTVLIVTTDFRIRLHYGYYTFLVGEAFFIVLLLFGL